MPKIRRLLNVTFACVGILLALSIDSSAQNYYFYKHLNYGSQSTYNPVSIILNGGYDILQYDGYTHDVRHFPYRVGARNVWQNISNPGGPISRYGWRNFVSHEIFPLTLNKKGAQWLPNYKLHLIGGGMEYRMTYEWYLAHDFPAPRLFSVATTFTYHYINEITENGAYIGDNVDPIADLCLFDPAGIILFSFDSVCKFFSEKLNLTDWSMIPSFSVRDLSIQNQGQNFALKWKSPFSERWRLFYYFGDLGMTGVSRTLSDSLSISVALGARATSFEMVDETTHRRTVKLVWSGGLFYDKYNSLLCSLFLSGSNDKLFNLNVYPGLLHLGKFSPGLWTIVSKHGNVTFGISTIWTPGLAFK